MTLSKFRLQLRAVLAGLKPNYWWPILQGAVLLVSVGWLIRTLIATLSRTDFSDLRLNASALIAACVCVFVAYWLGTFAWSAVVKALYPDVGYLQAVKYHVFSMVIKYLPGLGWNQVSKAVRLYRVGVPAHQTYIPVIVELGLIILTGLTTTTQILMATQQPIFGFRLNQVLQLGLTVLLWSICVILPLALLRLMIGKLPSTSNHRRFLIHLWFAEGLDVFGWSVLGISLWFTVRSLIPVPLDVLPYCIVVLIISFCIGLFVLFVPNGFGVRELTMVTLLSVIVPVPIAVLVSFMSRIINIMSDMLWFLPFGAIDLYESLTDNPKRVLPPR